MRVVTRQEEDAYLKAATELGRTQESDYEQALKGIRATVRGERPIKPDAYLLLHIATVLLECALRPDECYRLKWNQIQDEAIIIHEGKGKGFQTARTLYEASDGHFGNAPRRIGMGFPS